MTKIEPRAVTKFSLFHFPGTAGLFDFRVDHVDFMLSSPLSLFSFSILGAIHIHALPQFSSVCTKLTHLASWCQPARSQFPLQARAWMGENTRFVPKR